MERNLASDLEIVAIISLSVAAASRNSHITLSPITKAKLLQPILVRSGVGALGGRSGTLEKATVGSGHLVDVVPGREGFFPGGHHGEDED